MAGLAFEHATTPIGIDGGAAAMGTDRSGVSIFPSHLAEHLVGCVFGQIAKIEQRDRVRAAADIRKCCATAEIHKNCHGYFVQYSEADVYFK
jgi:hypothetical protein